MGDELLNIRGLRTYYFTRVGTMRAVDGVDLHVRKGETVGLVGESGSGKSTLGLSILRLVPPPGRIVGGEILFDGRDLLGLNDKEMLEVRGRRISMIFQDPMASLNPLMRIGDHLIETIMAHERVTKQEAKERALSLLDRVGILPERLNDYPHQFSGGMRQRVMIAMALALNPDLVIADEPVTALDVVIQAQIMDLMRKLKSLHNMALILITHDISVVAEVAERIAVMYAGQLIEDSHVIPLFEEPLHPYTEALLQAVPNVQLSDQVLRYIPGTPPDLAHLPSGCRFHPRCPYASDICRRQEPPQVRVGQGRMVKCFRYV